MLVWQELHSISDCFLENFFPEGELKQQLNVRVSHGRDCEEYFFCDMTPCSLVEIDHCLGGANCFHCFHFQLYILVDFFQIVWCDTPEGNICQHLNNSFMISVYFTVLTLIMCRIMGLVLCSMKGCVCLCCKHTFHIMTLVS